ncbi:MAG: Asp-tRNA(Asn)/Glu-tRNA(Gln) amidotransferase subunit GatC [Patescibacteria group bacterium]
MSLEINKKTLEHLAKLSKIDLDPQEEEHLAQDMQSIVDYVKVLQSLDTSSVSPMNGGGELENSFRQDSERENTNQGNGRELFPHTHEGLLAVPPVFK